LARKEVEKLFCKFFIEVKLARLFSDIYRTTTDIKLYEKKMQKSFSGDYWNTITKKSIDNDREDLWRAHMKKIYQKLIDRWIEDSNDGIALKTDLYDEAISTHNLIPLFGNKCKRIIGIDISFEIASSAKRRMMKEWNGWHNIVVCDVRDLVFKSNTFNEIISNSTLDHFSDKMDILSSLIELCRILQPGGTLIITLDNPSNPIVFLRNLLPSRLLKSFGLIPFDMGVTISKHELIRILKSSGFEVHNYTAIVHSPRILGIWIGYVINRMGNKKIKIYFHRLLGIFEHLEKLPMRYMTGYFVAVKAIKKQK